MKVNLVREGLPVFIEVRKNDPDYAGLIGCGRVKCLGEEISCDNCICANEKQLGVFEYTVEMLKALGRVQKEEEKVSIEISKEQARELLAVLNDYEETYVLPKDLFETIEVLKEILSEGV